jgi:adenine phosphoribosyltransferase
MHRGLLAEDKNVVIVDDVLATGGTVLACQELVDMSGAKTAAHLFLLEISQLNGRDAIQRAKPGIEVVSLLRT